MPLTMSSGAKLLLFGVRHRQTIQSRDLMARRASRTKRTDTYHVGANWHTTALKTQACLGLERVEDPIPPSSEGQKPGLAAIEKSLFERNACKRRSGGFIAGDHRADSCAQIASHRNAMPAETHRVMHTVIVASEVRKKVESEGHVAFPRVFYTHPLRSG